MRTLFDRTEAFRRQDEGHDQVRAGGWGDGETWLVEAQRIAEKLVKERGRVTSDDIWALRPPTNLHPNIMGCLFRLMRLPIIDYQPSERAAGRGRRIAVYGRPHVQD